MRVQAVAVLLLGSTSVVMTAGTNFYRRSPRQNYVPRPYQLYVRAAAGGRTGPGSASVGHSTSGNGAANGKKGGRGPIDANRQKSLSSKIATDDPGPSTPQVSCQGQPTPPEMQVTNLGTRKQALTAAGAGVLDLAIGMQETQDLTTNYPYGDTKPNSMCPSGDCANFGVFKQNWGLLRTCCSQFSSKNLQATDYKMGAVLNSHLDQDLSCLHQCQKSLGLDKWFAGHRNGASGEADVNQQVVIDYKNSVLATYCTLQSNSALQTDDTRVAGNVQELGEVPGGGPSAPASGNKKATKSMGQGAGKQNRRGRGKRSLEYLAT